MTDTVTNERLREIAVSKSLYGSGITYLEFIGIASELLARRTAPAEPVAVKPLEWQGSWGTHSADTELGTYEIKPRYDGAADWFAPDQRKHWASSATEAKAAAQADYEARIRTAPASPTISDEMAPTHRHKRRGTEYVLIGYGTMQAERWAELGVRATGEPTSYTVDMREVAIYRSATDQTEIWVRPLEEFEDGRFEALGGHHG